MELGQRPATRTNNENKKDAIVSSDIEFASTLVSPVAPPRRTISRIRRIWPVAGLGFALIVNVAWIGFLGFGLFKLIEAAFL